MPLLIFGGDEIGVAGGALVAARARAVAAPGFPCAGGGGGGNCGGAGTFLLIACICAIAAAVAVTFFRALTIPL